MRIWVRLFDRCGGAGLIDRGTRAASWKLASAAVCALLFVAGAHAHVDDGRPWNFAPSDFYSAPKNLILWSDLEGAYVKRGGGRFEVTFPPSVSSLNGRRVTLLGFMVPVDEGKHRKFLLTDRPFLCSGCHVRPPPPQSMVEVHTRVAEAPDSSPMFLRGELLRLPPVMVQGVLRLVNDHPHGLIYRLHDARVIPRRP